MRVFWPLVRRTGRACGFWASGGSSCTDALRTSLQTWMDGGTPTCAGLQMLGRRPPFCTGMIVMLRCEAGKRPVSVVACAVATRRRQAGALSDAPPW